jgi:hypothetical protein
MEKGSGSGRKSCVYSAFVGVTEVVMEEEGGSEGLRFFCGGCCGGVGGMWK